MDMTSSRTSWLRPTEAGLYCGPGDFHIDPHRPVARAVITHGHSDTRGRVMVPSWRPRRRWKS
jgi:hypothetical protein